MGQRESKQATQKTEWHEACGYAYRVVRCDGEVTASKVYRGGWIAKNQESACRTFHEANFRDAVKDHCECKKKLQINPKTDQIPVVFHNLRGYDAHHLMQAMSQLQKEVECIAKNMEKYIAFSVGELNGEEYEHA